MGLICTVMPLACGGGEAPEADVGAEAVASLEESVEVPDFTIPTPVGAFRVIRHTDEMLMLDYPGADLERIVEFYDEWTASQPSTFTRTDAPEGGISWMNETVDRSVLVLLTEARDIEIVSVTLGAH